MATDLTEAVPPDDSGADTFARYRYQAFLTFLLCLDCALGGQTISVIPEHFEDIAVQTRERWRLIQIKTRNLERGPWKLGDLLAEGGGFHSLVRSYNVVPGVECTYELWLEGPLKRSDPIQNLRTEEGRSEGSLVEQVRTKLALSAEGAAVFLKRVRLFPDQPGRADVVNRNLRHLGLQAPHLLPRQLEAIHSALVSKIESAMTGEELGDAWPIAIVAPDVVTNPIKARVDAKRLTRDILAPLVAPISSAPKPLLRRFVGGELRQSTVLEEKLVIGGATDRIIENAKSLRANAAIREAELASSELLPQDDVLEDVRHRLEIRVEALRARYEQDDRPAVQIWLELIGLLSGQAATIDGHGIFSRDPDLLLGEICQMSDLCITGWGVVHA